MIFQGIFSLNGPEPAAPAPTPQPITYMQLYWLIYWDGMLELW